MWVSSPKATGMFVRLKLYTGAWANVMPKSWTSLRAYSGHSAAREVVQLQFGKIQIEVVLGGRGREVMLVELEAPSSHRADQGSTSTEGHLDT